MSHCMALSGWNVTWIFLWGICVVPLWAQEIPRFRIKEEKAREYFARGLGYHNNRQYMAAREFFYKALDTQPYFHLARRYLGDAYYYSGDWNAALEQWELLDEFASGVYPLVRQRSDLLRFALSAQGEPGPYTLFRYVQTGALRSAPCLGPVDLALDPVNHVYLACFDSGRIVQFNSEGELVRDFSGPFWDRLGGPLAVLYHRGQLYVADYKKDRIRIFDARGSTQASWGERGTGPGQFYGPTGLAMGRDGLFVADQGNHRIVKFNHEGQPTGSFTLPDEEEPAGLALGPEGQLFVSLPRANQILVYDQDGNLLRDLTHSALRSPMHLHVHGRQLYIANQTGGLLLYDIAESTFRLIEGLRDEGDQRKIKRV